MLLAVRSDPEAKTVYGAKKDFGYKSAGERRGLRFPAGYRVYLYPNWYVWDLKDRVQVAAKNDLPSVNGKYRRLLRKLYLPQDQSSYKNFTDYGVWSGTSYRQFTNLPKGYWVYVYPHWYIWAEQNPNWQGRVPTVRDTPLPPVGPVPAGKVRGPGMALPPGLVVGPNMNAAQRKKLMAWLKRVPANQRPQAIELIKRELRKARKK